MEPSAPDPSRNRGLTPVSGIVLSCLQLAFALTWVVYVIYLPSLALQAGIPRSAVPWILLMDQLVFVACDWAAGVYADRVGKAVGRVGPRIAAVTLVSATAFMAMPWLAPLGSPWLFIALTVVWSVTSSALRAPPLTLFARHASVPGRAWLAGLYMLGLGIAAALAPYLGSALKNIDPRVPFMIATAMVVIVTLVVAAAEQRVAGVAKPAEPAAGPSAEVRVGVFALAVVLFALGFQLHFAVLSAPSYLRFAAPADLERLMPVFWIGFNLAVLPATLLAKRFGGLNVIGVAGIVGAVLICATIVVRSLDALVAVQFAVGAAWGVVLTSAFAGALEAGRPGREGSVTGMLFSMLAIAAFARIAFVATDATRILAASQLFQGAPALFWLAACTALIAMATRTREALTRSR